MSMSVSLSVCVSVNVNLASTFDLYKVSGVHTFVVKNFSMISNFTSM